MQENNGLCCDNPDLYENMKAIDFINFICDMYEVSEILEEKIR